MKQSIFLLVLMILSIRSNAQWSSDPTVNNPISTASGDQQAPTIVSDGSGGAIITWYDHRNGDNDIYAQRINASGVIQWTADGVTISTAGAQQFEPTIVSDGSGGAIITWADNRSGNGTNDIYAQRINASGVIQWTVDGVAISTASGVQQNTTIVTDGSGGAIIAWNDNRSGNVDIYAQRISASGAIQWTPDGAAISAASGDQYIPTIVSDGFGGAIVTWFDVRSGNNIDIYAQRISASGVIQWTADGAAISTANGNQSAPSIVSDGSGGAIITWDDFRGLNSDIYAQRINASGVVQWTANGVAISISDGHQVYPKITGDDSGAAIITWQDGRVDANNQIYAQRINASGVTQWTADGTALSVSENQLAPAIISDGSGGAIITWYDLRAAFDIYAQRINAGGVIQWTFDAVAISNASGNQRRQTIAADGSGGAIIVWNDERSGGIDIYAQRVDSDGLLGASPMRYCRSNLNKPIPDNNPAGIRDTLTISGVPPGHVVQGIALKIDSLSHTWVGDLRMTLSHNGITRTLMNRPGTGGNGSNGDNFVGTVLADFAHARIDSIAGEGTPPPGGPPFTGSFRPDSGGAPGIVLSSLDPFVGSDPNGQWILFVNDNASQDSGRVHAWCLELQTAPPPPATFCRTNVNKAIPDVNPSGVRDTLGISGITPGHVVQSIALRIDSLSHTFVGDLNMTLSHNGITRTLMSRPGTGPNGSQGNNFVGTVLVDSATQRIDSIASAGAPYTGFFRPDSGGAPSIVPSSLAPFIGSDPNGDWVLFINDVVSDDSGKIHSWCLILQTGISTDVDPVDHTVPEIFALEQNYPNPFNPTTTIRFALPVSAHVTLKIYNVLGQEVATLVDEPQNAGTFNAIWNGRSSAGLSVASGVYFYQLIARASGSPEVFRSMKKMVVMK